jgi:hypothetical protein|tara:strand:- start:115 stop:537 length:423 start_codon:yes stop_codon:yes gene_type:complete
MAYATGKKSYAISDRSGMAFPYQEMVREWNGSLVHISEFESKHPQIRRKTVKADAIALRNTRPQDFTLDSGGATFTTANLSLPGPFSFQSSGMQPDDVSEQNRRRELIGSIGSVVVDASFKASVSGQQLSTSMGSVTVTI